MEIDGFRGRLISAEHAGYDSAAADRAMLRTAGVIAAVRVARELSTSRSQIAV
jgi:hypothetical protein